MHLRLLPWKGRKDGGTAYDEVSCGMQEAEAAEDSAKKNLEETKRRGVEVNRVVRRLREFQEVNHIGERVVIALQEGYGKQNGERGH